MRRRPSKKHYDVMDSCVVNADAEFAARDYASMRHGDEGKDVWLDNNLSECLLLGKAASNIRHGILCRDFNAG